MAKPSIPNTGARKLDDVVRSTSRKPMMGPVHENDTMVSVVAIRKMPTTPPLASAALSVLFPQEEGSVISNPPIKLAAKTMSIAKHIRLNTALVDNALSPSEPKSNVISRPIPTYIIMIDKPYMTASRMPPPQCSALFMK